MHSRKATPRCIPTMAGLAFAFGLVSTAPAFVFTLGEAKGSFDTTVSIGGLHRLQDPDHNLYGLSAGGLQRSANADDGNLNYRAGLASLLVKANHDLQLDYRNAGLFVRGYYFNDFENSQGTRARTPLNADAERLVAQGGELLDAYVYFKPELANLPMTLRLGRQVLSWGESTFIPNGINSVNPIDVAKLRTPGSELKEALLPLNLFSASVNLSDEVSLEAFYLLDWERTRVDPPGTYFSTNDFVAQGGTRAYFGFGAITDSSPIGFITRGPDREPSKSGQYGVNLRWLAAGLNDTEFGFYYMNYHSRLPVLAAHTPTVPVNVALVGSDSGAALKANATFMGSLAAALGTTNPVVIGTTLTQLIGATLTGIPATAFPAHLQSAYATVASVTGPIAQRELLTAASTAQYLIEFPEDIRLYGASFNTSVKGVALQGELSYRDNQPLQIDDVELLFSSLSPLSTRFAANNQIGTAPLNSYVAGYRRHKVWTGQMSATNTTRGFLGAAQTTLLAEAGFVHANLPSKSTRRYDGPGTFVGGDLNYMNNSGSNASGIPPLSEPPEAFADKFSWGYQLLGRLDYHNVFAGVNASPLLSFGHDVNGNTPLPLGNFRQNRKTLTVGVDFTFQNAWACEIRYVNFFGAGRYNLLHDRDYISATLKYSF